MTFIEALAEYHKGKAIIRKKWRDDYGFFPSIVEWVDLFANDWIVLDSDKDKK